MAKFSGFTTVTDLVGGDQLVGRDVSAVAADQNVKITFTNFKTAIANDWNFDVDGTNLGIGVATGSPLARVHAQRDGAATATYNGATLLIVEDGNSSAGISISTPATVAGNIFFVDPGSATAGRYGFDHSSDTHEWDIGGSTKSSLSAGDFTLTTTSKILSASVLDMDVTTSHTFRTSGTARATVTAAAFVTNNTSNFQVKIAGGEQFKVQTGGVITIANLPAAAGASGTLWYDATDSNRVKYVP